MCVCERWDIFRLSIKGRKVKESKYLIRRLFIGNICDVVGILRKCYHLGSKRGLVFV